MKEISIIIPVYNGEKYIHNICENLIQQTIFEDLEIIFVNDGSTDNSKELIESYSIKYENIIQIVKKNGGVSSARNIGINASSCEKICFVDVDDYLDYNYFETMLSKLPTDLLISGYIAEYPAKKVKTICKCKKNDGIDLIIKEFLFGNIDPNCWGKIYDKKVLGNLRFNEKFSHSEDRLFVYQYLLKCKSVSFESNTFYHYVINEDSVMHKKFNKNMFDSIEVMEFINNDIKEKFEKLHEISDSCLVDAKCRVVSQIAYFKKIDENKIEYNQLLYEIKKYSLIKKIKNSSLKHFFAFLIMRTNVKLYNFLKNDMKLQYKN